MTRSFISMMVFSFGLIFSAPAVFASNYPADTPMYADAPVTVGPLTVVRSMQLNGEIALDVTYSGYLVNSSVDELSLTAVVNYSSGQRVGTFKLVNMGNSTYQVRLTTGCLVGKLGGCAQWASDEMRDLLFWAAGYYHLNALDIEFAVSNDKGQWDSNESQNYEFHFPASR